MQCGKRSEQLVSGGPHFVDTMISRDKDMKDMAAAPAATDWFSMRIFCIFLFSYFFSSSSYFVFYIFVFHGENDLER